MVHNEPKQASDGKKRNNYLKETRNRATTMITNYRTQGTIAYSLMRHIFVRDSRGSAIFGGKHGMIPCVDRLDNLQLLVQDWANDLSNAIGLALFVDGNAYVDDPISEQCRCWSHGNRLRLGRFRT